MSTVALGATGAIALAARPDFHLGEIWPFLIAADGPVSQTLSCARCAKPARHARPCGWDGPACRGGDRPDLPERACQRGAAAGRGAIVAGGFALANERVRPEDFRRLGVLFAVGATVLFAVRDNVLRAIARDTTVDALVAAPVSLLAGTTTVAPLPAGHAERRVGPRLRHRVERVPAGRSAVRALLYRSLPGLLPRPRSVVAPLVATESLWGVAFLALLLRRTELVGRRLVAGAILIVAGGVLIGASR